MPLAYAVKHVFRSWKLFLALLIGITLASAFFAGTDIKANMTANQALDQLLSSIPVDMTASVHMAQNLTQILNVKEKISDIEGVADVEIIFSAEGHIMQYDVKIAGVANDSRIFDGWLNRPSTIDENETYILEGSILAGEVKINHTIQVNFTAYFHWQNWQIKGYVPINLTVKGLARLDDKAYSIAYAIAYRHYFNPVQSARSDTLILMVDSEKTMWKLMEAAYINTSFSGRLRDAGASILIYLDRDALIAPWDIDTSINNIKALEYAIENEIATLVLGVDVQNNLEGPLNTFRSTSMNIRFMITLVSFPIFFVAWYMGTTVSDVSFNLRRREVGLLLTKGFSRRQVLAKFLTETLLIGIIGSTLGISFGFLLNPLFTQLSTEEFFNLQAISSYTVIFTVAFGVIIAFLSTFSSARRASRLNIVDALREYLPTQIEKPYKKRWPWVAFILGTYKTVVFLSGLNMSLELNRIAFGAGNFIVILLIGFCQIVDGMLNYIGPLLFLWGFMKLFILGSLKFQELTAKAGRFLGDLSILATRNVRRHPPRSAATAFLVALIVSYGVQVTGQLASEQDYTVRNVYYQVGSDVTIYVPLANDAPNILDVVMANVSEKVQNATIEYSFSTYSSSLAYVKLKAVEPRSWLKAAYYENEWFTGNDVTTAFNILAANKGTIILERIIAKQLKLEVGETITLQFDTSPKKLKVVGFFGPDPSELQLLGGTSGISQDLLQYRSFVSEKLYKEISSQVSASAKILLKSKSGIEGKSLAETIRKLNSNISSVISFDEAWEEAQSDVITIGVLDVQRLGIVFAVLAASVGTGLVSTVSMKERRREATIMSAKGLSYKHLLIVFLTENVALVGFSLVLGIIVGLIVVHGTISATNASISSVIKHRLVFPLDSTLMLSSCIVFIFISTILPILIMLRRYVTFDRMARSR